MKSVTVITVTYGDREPYVTKLVQALSKMNPVERIIVVWNGNKPTNKATFAKDKVQNIFFKQNMGSAVAFSKGLKTFAKDAARQSDFVWMLDDDNLPNQDALEILLADYSASTGKEVFASFRKDRIELKQRGYQKYYPNSFFEFSLQKKFADKFMKKTGASQDDKRLITCETVPYGGLLMPKSVLRQIGFPNESMYLYSDDNDFTYRMTKLGYKIRTDVTSMIVDMEQSWYRKNPVPMFKTVFSSDNLFNAVYTIRNRVFFERHAIVTNKMSYFTNIFVYLCYVGLFYMPKNRQGLKRIRLVVSLIKSGWHGQLGKIPVEKIKGWSK